MTFPTRWTHLKSFAVVAVAAAAAGAWVAGAGLMPVFQQISYTGTPSAPCFNTNAF